MVKCGVMGSTRHPGLLNSYTFFDIVLTIFVVFKILEHLEIKYRSLFYVIAKQYSDTKNPCGTWWMLVAIVCTI